MIDIEKLISEGKQINQMCYFSSAFGVKPQMDEFFETWISKVRFLIKDSNLGSETNSRLLQCCDDYRGFSLNDNNFEKIMGFLNAALVHNLPSSTNTTAPAKLTIMNTKKVFVVHGRNNEITTSMKSLLRAMELEILEWEQCVTLTSTPTPSIQQILEAGFRQAQAIIILFTPDEEAHLREGLGNNDECQVGLQPRLNVIYEAGMAMGIMPKRTVLVNFGRLRGLSDLAGIHYIDFVDDAQSRHSLVNRLKLAGVEFYLEGKTDWLRTGAFPPTV